MRTSVMGRLRLLVALASVMRATGVAVRSKLEMGTPAGSAIRPQVVPEFTSPLSPPRAPPPAPPPLTCMSLDVSVDGSWCTLTCASDYCPPTCYCGSPADVAEAVGRRDAEKAEMDEAAYVPPPEPVQALPVPEPVFSDGACDFDRQGCINSTLAGEAPVAPKCAGCEDYPIAPSANTVTSTCRSCGDHINICHINGLTDEKGNFTAQTIDECIDQVAKLAGECKTCSTPHNKEAYRWRLGMPEIDASGDEMTAWPDSANAAEQAASEATEIFENAEAEADNNRRKIGAESKRAEQAGKGAMEEAEADAAVLRDEAEEEGKAQVAAAAQAADAAEEDAKAQAAVAALKDAEAYADAEAAFADAAAAGKAAKAAAQASREAAAKATKKAERADKAAHDAAADSPLPSPSPSWCAMGLSGFDKSICCAASCGRCGGNGCDKLPGGRSKCCSEGFANVPCGSPKQTACVVPSDVASAQTRSDAASERRAGGAERTEQNPWETGEPGHWGDDGQWVSDVSTAEGQAAPKAEQAAAPGDWKSEQDARQRVDHGQGCCGSPSGPSVCWGCGEEGHGLCHMSSESCSTKCEGAWLASEGRPLCALETRVRVASEEEPWLASVVGPY